MALSEHEQRMLNQLEQALAKEDPRFAHSMRSPHLGPRRRTLALGALGFALGLALVVAGVMSQWWIGVIGFLVMVLAGVYAFTPRRPGLRVVDAEGSVRAAHPAGRGRGRGATAMTNRKRGSGNAEFMQRLEERWERRRRDGYR